MTKIKDKLDKAFGPRYSPSEDKIYNCKKGTLTYFHEEGHRIQNQKGILHIYSWILTFTAGACTGFILAKFILYMFNKPNPANEIIYFAVLPWVIMYWYLEIDAWVYAFRKNMNKKEE